MIEPAPPVAALAYYDRSDDPWMAIIRLFTITAIVESGLSLLSCFVRIALYYLLPIAARGSNPIMSYISLLPLATASAVLLIGALMAYQMNPAGRQVIVIASWMLIVLSFVAFGVARLMFLLIGSRSRSYLLTSFITSFFLAIQGCVLPVMFIYFFRRPAVVNVFESRGQR